MHPRDEEIEQIKSTNDIEDARKWLKSAGRAYGVIHELTREESIEVVEEAYSRGATHVEVMGTIAPKASESSVDMVLITLPENKQDREMLFDLEAQIATMGGFDGSVDQGQKYLLLWWS